MQTDEQGGYKKCPFCGYGTFGRSLVDVGGYIECGTCGATGPDKHGITWNNRPAEAERNRMREALEPFAQQRTIDERLAQGDTSGFNDMTIEARIEAIGQRKRDFDANVLRARAALSPTNGGDLD